MALGIGGYTESNTKWLTPNESVYEAHILAKPEEVPNPFYNPDTDSLNKKFQLKWTITLDKDDVEAQNGAAKEDESYSTKISYFTGTHLGSHPKNKMTNLVKILDPEFVLSKGYASEDEFYEKMVGAPLRVVTAHKPVEKEGTTRIYSNVSALMKSAKPRASMADILAAQTGGSVEDTEAPF